MFCYKCKSKLDLVNKKISFRQTCPVCFADLHVCLNCKHYAIGKPNNCNVPNTEFVADRGKNNFCEDFEIKNCDNSNTKTKKDVSKKLFKDDDDDSDRKSFDSLFKD